MEGAACSGAAAPLAPPGARAVPLTRLPRPPQWARRSAFRTALCPGPVSFVWPRLQAAVGRPSFPAGGWPSRACVYLPVPPGLSVPDGKRGPEDREHLRSFVEWGKGAEQANATGEICHSPL